MLFLCHQFAMQREAEEKRRKLAEEGELSGSQSRDINVPIIWVLGGPGCGKGTQCDKIVERYKFKHISTGDLLRAEVASGSNKGKQLEQIMKEGKLVSNEDVLQLLETAVHKAAKEATGFLIDGYPREKDQGAAFEKFIGPVDLILFFDCKNETLVARILHRAKESTEVRADDNEETLKKRIETFRTNTDQILEQYSTKTVTIDAERSVDEIFSDVIEAIDQTLEVKKAAVAATA